MRIGLIDVDNWNNLKGCSPNLPLMKLSAWHKEQGDFVEWYDSLKHYDLVYMSKVFSFTHEPFEEIHADQVIKGGSGYAIQLIDSKANVEFNQGVDIRLMTDERCEMLMQMKIKHIHFAWDRYQEKEVVVPKLQRFKEITGWSRSKVTVYILTNYDTTMEENLERVTICRKLGFNPYIMRYDKEHIPRGSEINKLARYVNNKMIFWLCPTFEQYKEDLKKGLWR